MGLTTRKTIPLVVNYCMWESFAEFGSTESTKACQQLESVSACKNDGIECEKNVLEYSGRHYFPTTSCKPTSACKSRFNVFQWFCIILSFFVFIEELCFLERAYQSSIKNRLASMHGPSTSGVAALNRKWQKIWIFSKQFQYYFMSIPFCPSLCYSVKCVLFEKNTNFCQ